MYRAESFGKDTSLVVLAVLKISELYLGAVMSYEALSEKYDFSHIG